MENLLNVNAGYKSWENIQIWLQGGEEEQWDAEYGKEMEKWEDLMCDLFSPCVILWFLLLNAGKEPFRRMWSTTLQHFPLLPGASAECRAAFGGTGIWELCTLLHPPPQPSQSHQRGLAAPRIHHSIETAFASLGAC